MTSLLWLIVLPVLGGLLALIVPNRIKYLKEAITLLVTAVNLGLVIFLFNQTETLSLPWGGFGLEFALRLYQFSGFILLAVAGFSFLITLYSVVFMADRPSLNQYYAYFLLTLAATNGAVLANNLILLLFFWESLLLMTFGLIYIGGGAAYKTAIKSFVLVGVTDLSLLLGIGMTGHLAGTFTMSQISLPLSGAASLAFILMMLGAIAKAGSIPFHSWIPDAATDAPLPFMAFLPGALEKLLGIYLLARITLDLFRLTPGSWLSPLLMAIGGLTIILAVMMALVQKDYKRLLSYHAISQVGYMILGIGTAVPAGIIGGLFHMINNALYKSGLFLTGGSVEKQTGSTDLAKLGGLARQMPVTFACFFVTACAISGVPPFNGFFSKELIYDGALERGGIYYFMAIAGSFLTAASFLKLGHAAYFGRASEQTVKAKESPWLMLLPMVVIALVCVVFGVYNYLPLNYLLQPVLGEARLAGHNFSGWPHSAWLVGMTLAVILAAIANHWYGVKRSGSGLGAVDHIHYTPGLKALYDRAEKRWFDPYEIGLKLAGALSRALWAIDRLVDRLYEGLTVGLTRLAAKLVSRAHNGRYSRYIFWSLVGAAVVIVMMLRT